MTDWIQDPQTWNKVRLGTILLPGIAEVTSSRGRDIDFQKAPGKDGGYSVDKGEQAAKVKLRLRMKAADWPEWKRVLPLIDPNGGKPRGPYGISHPDPNSRGITMIDVKDISTSPPTAKGGYVVDLDCQGHTPKPKETKVKKDSTGRPRPEPTAYTSFLPDQQGRPVEQRATDDAANILENSFGPQTRIGTTVLNNGESFAGVT